jgi:glucosyl-3-phosphoglycerate synthase
VGDFHQNGIVTTLHNLSGIDRWRYMEAELVSPSPGFRPHGPGPAIALLGTGGPGARYHRRRSLTHVPYLESDRGRPRSGRRDPVCRARSDYFGRLPQHHRVLWNDGPRLQAMDAELRRRIWTSRPREIGKGRNVWYCYGLCAGLRHGESPSRCTTAISSPTTGPAGAASLPGGQSRNFSYEFCKGYYARVANGQDQRSRQQAAGDAADPGAEAGVWAISDFLEYMDSFRYPLAGEFSVCARTSSTIIRIPSATGGWRSACSREMHRNYSPAIVSVPGWTSPTVYDHKHQDARSVDDPARGLSKMSHRHHPRPCSASSPRRGQISFRRRPLPDPQGDLLSHRAGFHRDLSKRCDLQWLAVRPARRGNRRGALRRQRDGRRQSLSGESERGAVHRSSWNRVVSAIPARARAAGWKP